MSAPIKSNKTDFSHYSFQLIKLGKYCYFKHQSISVDFLTKLLNTFIKIEKKNMFFDGKLYMSIYEKCKSFNC